MQVADCLADAQAAETAKRQQYTGSLISLTADPVFVSLLTSTPTLFREFGAPYASSRFMNGASDVLESLHDLHK